MTMMATTAPAPLMATPIQLPLFSPRRGLPHVHLSVGLPDCVMGRVDVLGLVDSGSTHSLLRWDVWRQLLGRIDATDERMVTVEPWPTPILSAAGTIAPSGVVRLCVRRAQVETAVLEPFLLVTTLPVAAVFSKLLCETLGLVTVVDDDDADDASGVLRHSVEAMSCLVLPGPQLHGSETLLDGLYHDLEPPMEVTDAEWQEVIHDSCPGPARLDFLATFKMYPEIFSRKPPPVPALFEPVQLRIMPGAELEFQNPRPNTPVEKEAWKEILGDLQSAGIIEPSHSPHAAPAMLVTKAGTDPISFRMVVDFSLLNRYLHPVVFPLVKVADALRDLTTDRTVFAKLDLASAFFSVPVEETSRDLLTFSVREGTLKTFRFCRLPQGLSVSPGHFSSRLFILLRDLLGRDDLRGVTLCQYVDDLGLSATSASAMATLMREVCARLARVRLFVNPRKLVVAHPSISFLGHRLSANLIELDPDRVAAVKDMRPPRTRKQLQQCLGLFSWLSSHLQNARVLMAPLQKLLRQEAEWCWGETERTAFENLREAVLKAPGLVNISYTNGEACVIRTDASLAGCGAYLAQIQDGKLKPIAFLSHGFTSTEESWPPVEKEAFGVVLAVRKWRKWLFGLPATRLETDCRALVTLRASTNAKIRRWMLAISEMPYEAFHVKGEDNPLADWLSRAFLMQARCLEALAHCHSSTTGHWGVASTIRKLKLLNVTWSTMQRDVEEYIAACPFCQRNRPFAAPDAEKKVIVASEPFAVVSLDTFGPMPADVEGFKYVILCVDSMTRYIWMTPARDASAESAARALMEVVGHFGVPAKVQSDQGSQFTAQVVQALMRMLGTEQHTTLVQRPQSNGQAERHIGRVRKQLGILTSERRFQDKWSQLLPIVQLICNLEPCATTGVSPMQLMFPSVTPGGGLFKQRLLKDGEKLSPVLTYLQTMEECHDRLIQQAHARQQQYVAKQVGYKPKSPVSFAVGSLVLSTYAERPPNKLSLRLAGPWRVVARRDDNVYKLEDVLQPGAYVERHVSRLVQYNDSRTMDPRVVAVADSREFIVDTIVAHEIRKDPPGDKPRLWLKVHWLGYADEDDTFLPLTAVRHTEAWTTYREQHPELGRFK